MVEVTGNSPLEKTNKFPLAEQISDFKYKIFLVRSGSLDPSPLLMPGFCRFEPRQLRDCGCCHNLCELTCEEIFKKSPVLEIKYRLI